MERECAVLILSQVGWHHQPDADRVVINMQVWRLLGCDLAKIGMVRADCPLLSMVKFLLEYGTLWSG